MTATSTSPSLDEIRWAGQEALRREFSPTDLVRFFQQFITPSGDYTAERAELQRGITMEDVFDSIAKQRAARQGNDGMRPGLRSNSERRTMRDTLPPASEDEVLRAGVQALRQELGPAGVICFLQQFSKGRGDYTAGRDELLGEPSVDEIVDAIKRQRTAEQNAG